MTTPYLQKKGIDRFFGQPTSEELLNGSKGSNHWTPREYSTDPDYSEVESTIFDYLEEVEEG